VGSENVALVTAGARTVGSTEVTSKGGSGRPPLPHAIHTPPRWWETLAGRWVLRLLPGLAFLVGWQLYALHTDSSLIPTATETLSAAVEVLGRSEVWEAFARSNRILFIGFALSVVIGVPLGFLMGRVRAAEKLFDPWLDLLIIVPMAAVIPLVIMSLGLGLTGQVVVVILFTVSMITVNCRAGVREVPEVLLEMARCYGANEQRVWTRVMLPGASPAVFAGMRIGLGRSILGMVLVEMLMTAVGIGTLLQQYRAQFATPELYAVIMLIVLESVVLISLLSYVEDRLVPWAPHQARASD
jgi:ABC-type nitrate/sulfonate/bicarbonate transport system permease component